MKGRGELKFILVVLTVSLLLSSCNKSENNSVVPSANVSQSEATQSPKNSVPPSISPNNTNLNLETSDEELLTQFQNIETKTLETMTKFETFVVISEEEQKKLIQTLEEFYSSAKALSIFEHHFNKTDNGYSRIPIDFHSIRHIKSNLEIVKKIENDLITINISGDDGNKNDLEFEYKVIPMANKIDGVNIITSPY